MLPECPQASIGAVLDAPQPGFFAIRLGRLRTARPGGYIPAPWTPAAIYLPCPFILPEPYESWPPPKDWFEPLGRPCYPLQAMIGETVVENVEIIIKIWQGARGIGYHEWRFLVDRRRYCRRYFPDSFHAKPPNLAVLRNRELL